MAYNANIPNATDRFPASQPALLANFQEINTFVNTNHGPFGGATQGKHLFVEMPVQAITPVTIAGEVGLFSRTSTLTGVPELVYIPQSAGTPVEFTSKLANANAGWARFPSGILIKWGQAVAGVGDSTITFTVAATIPAFASPALNVYLQVLTTPGVDPNIACYVTNINVLDFTVLTTNRTSVGPGGPVLVSYLAIGV